MKLISFRNGRIILLLAVALYFSAVAAAIADDLLVSNSDESMFFTPEEMNSISSFRPKPVPESPGFITVITSKMIAAMAAKDLSDVLNIIPGFNVAHSNSNETQLSVLGLQTPSDILVMIDGHRFNNFHDRAALYDLPVDGIERVEVIRGPGSAMYGTNAVAAVINIIMKRAENGRIKAGIGSFNTGKLNAEYGDAWEDNRISAFAELYQTGGGDASIPWDRLSNNTATAPYSKAPATMKANQRKLMGDVQWDHGETNTKFAFYSDDRGPGFAYQNIVADGSKSASSYFSLDVTHPWGSERTVLFEPRLYADLWMVDKTIQLYPNGYTDNRDLNGDGLPEYFPNGMVLQKKYDVFTGGFELRGRSMMGDDNYLTVGGVVEDSSIRNPRVLTNYAGEPDVGAIPQAYFSNWNGYSFPSRSRDIYAVYAQDDWTPSRYFNLVAGVRYDHYSDFGDTVNPRAAMAFYPAAGYDIKLQYATAFRAPTFKELYDETDLQFAGNPSLKPEKIETLEAGAGYTYAANSYVRVNAYRETLSDYITTLFNTSLAAITRYQNSGKLEITGAGIEAKHSFETGTFFMWNLSIFNAKDVVSDSYLTQVPQLRGNAVLGIDLPAGFNGTLTYNYYGTSKANARTSQEIIQGRADVEGPFNIVNLALRKKNAASGVSIKLSAFNLLNADFREIYSDIRYRFPTVPDIGTVKNHIQTNQRMFLFELEKEF